MKKNKLVLAIVVIMLCFPFGGHFFNKWYHSYVKKHPEMYVYDTFLGPPNPVLIIKNKKRYGNKLVQYYKQLEKGVNATFNIPLKTLPQYEPVYVMKFSEDSLLAKVVCYYDYGPMHGGNFTIGWVYAKCLHKEPPPPRSLRKENVNPIENEFNQN
ncbi:MAG: hypothetical protein LBV47_03100 [Bacteroidales bacterium]|jgi:hypothetical protein|nr:hypothetical protein [Bacteroidales bacterium]